MKKTERTGMEKALIIIAGSIIFLLGLALSLISIPLMFILIGFFTIFVGAFILIFGFRLIMSYKYYNIECPKCGSYINPGFKNKQMCTKCKNIIEFN